MIVSKYSYLNARQSHGISFLTLIHDGSL